MTVTTVEGWRVRKVGPAYTKVGGAVMYAVADVEEWERRNRIATDGKAPRTIAATQKPAEACQ